MTGRLWSWVVSAVLLGITAVSAQASTELRSLRIESQPEVTQIRIDLSASTPTRWFVLDQPRRLVVDLANTGKPKQTLPPANGAVRALRAGPQANGDLRLVFEIDPVVQLQPIGSQGSSNRTATLEFSLTSPADAPISRAPLKEVRAAHAPPTSGREVIVAIDAGHGGQDPGAIGRAGTNEKDVVLDISRRLAARINQEPGMRAVLTRDGDYFLKHRERIRRARAAGAQLFVSVHADAVRDPSVSGSSVYVLSEKGASDEQSRWLADRENAADLAGGISLDDKDPVIASVLVDLAQSAQIGQSVVAAERVLRSLRRVNEVRKPQVQQAGFLVLKSPDIPSMLVETAFISSPSDERLLNIEGKRAELADAIFDGVRQFFLDHPPEGSRFALERDRGRTVVATAPEAAAAGKL
ncbi:MAG: N-acetylmuramoyl-L-alanine amidase [Gammaproteobacteria bacterium]|nr:N-acetylmuramoyl-L-alanine amidase [Gammaproteobacteria bacterium]